jgi:hypothetical protein
MPRLPNCIHNLTSLQDLIIKRRNSPNVVSVVSSFSEEGFPANLTSLIIRNCNFTQALLEWGLHRLTSLQRLEITGGCPNVESFPEKMLPASLTTLHHPRLSQSQIHVFPSRASPLLKICILKSVKISHPFQRMACLPHSTDFDIYRCPLLKEHCRKDQGREWSKIAHIPCVKIDGKVHLRSQKTSISESIPFSHLIPAFI